MTDTNNQEKVKIQAAIKLQELAESRFDLKTAKLNLLEIVDSNLSVTHNGGLFTATTSVISYISVYANDHGPDAELVMLDEYNNPIKVNASELKHLLYEAHQYALNSYYEEYHKLKKVRKGDKL